MTNRPHSRQKRVKGTATVSTRNKNITRTASGGSIVLIIAYVVFSLLFNNRDESTILNNNNHIPTTTYNYNTNDNDVDNSIAEGARDKFTNLKGSNKDQVTVMIYMIGSNLESDYGMGTKDIQEILYGLNTDNSNLNVVLQTGGAKKWNNNVISSSTMQRYQLCSNGLKVLNKNVGNNSMTDPNSLKDFITYSKKNFPANRYFLILWDHGGGSVSGYGYDEKFGGASMSVDKLANAIKSTSVKFDMIGFDACLMANLETAIALEPYADYLLASEEVEPGNGWYYTNWINSLNTDTSISTLSLGKEIIDDYIKESIKTSGSNVGLTLSLTDLSELSSNVDKALDTFSKNLQLEMKDNYAKLSNARSVTKEYGTSNKIDQVDLVHLASNMKIEGSNELIEAVKKAVKYNQTYNISNSYGLSVYFPYTALSKMNSLVEIYDNINISDNYSTSVKEFAQYAASGQVVNSLKNNGTTSNIFEILNGNYSISSPISQVDISSLLNQFLSSSNSNPLATILGGNSNWLDNSLIDTLTNVIGRDSVDDSQFKYINKNGNKVISLSEKQWSLINSIALSVFVDDGTGYIDLGLDNTFDYDKDGDLIAEYDNTWLSINGYPVAYYLLTDEYIDDENYSITGKIPAYLNGKLVDIMVVFNDENPYGLILGAQLKTNNSTIDKGLIDIKNGDVIDFVCKYYDYNGNFKDNYKFSESLIVNGPLELYNVNLTNTNFLYLYRFTDIYGNHFFSEAIKEK